MFEFCFCVYSSLVFLCQLDFFALKICIFSLKIFFNPSKVLL